MAQTPFSVVARASQAYIVSCCLKAVVQAGIADALGDTPKTAQDLAASTGTHAEALGRILRVLCTEGIFEVSNGGYVHTPASRVLRKDDPRSLHGFVRMATLPVFYDVFAEMAYSLSTGKSTFDAVHPGGLFKYLAAHPEEGRIFNEGMTGKAHGQVAGVVSHYDFSRFVMIADIGGGHGHLLQAVLASAPNSKGILFDQASVIQEAAGSASDRLTLQAGDFFKDSMPVADAYLIMQVIHDWPDAEATRILSGIRRAAPAHAKLLLIELLIPESRERDWAKEVDLIMLVIPNSRERTRTEYQQLLAGSGFHLDRVIDIGQSTAILEATPV